MAFEDRQTQYEALLAAFCLVACSDGEMHTAELTRFLHQIQDKMIFGAVDEQKLLADIEKEKTALDHNFAKAKDRLLEKIKAVKNDFRTMKNVIEVARITLISDNRITESEEVILSEIHRILGLSEQDERK